MMESPSFISLTPGPSAVSPRRSKRWNGLSFSNTVSRWPISNIRRPFPEPTCSATTCPARPTASIGTHRTRNPRFSSSSIMIRPTSATPALFIVPLLMFTSLSSIAIAGSRSACAAATIRFSGADSAAALHGAETKISIPVETRPNVSA